SDGQIADLDRRRKRGLQLVCKLECLLRIARAAKQRGELIAAVTCDDVGRSRPGFYPFADFGEHRVTPPMASAVVDELKAVQIDHHHREGVVQRRLCASKRALRRPLEDLTVVETCE